MRSRVKQNAVINVGVVFPVKLPKYASVNCQKVCGEQIRKWLYVLRIHHHYVYDNVRRHKCYDTHESENGWKTNEYHCVLSRILRIFKVATWHYRCHHRHKNVCTWDNLLLCFYSAAKFALPIVQPSNNAAKCGIRRSWKLKVKPNPGCCSNIAISISYI